MSWRLSALHMCNLFTMLYKHVSSPRFIRRYLFCRSEHKQLPRGPIPTTTG